MDPLEAAIEEIKKEFGENSITTTNTIDRPQQSLDRDMFVDFNERNPMMDGGRIGFYKGKLVEAGPNKGSYVVPVSNERVYFSPEEYGSKAKAKKAMEQFIKDRPGTGSAYKGVGRIPLNKTQQKIFDKIKRYNLFSNTGDSQIKTKIRSGEYTKKIVDDYVKAFDLVKKENLINLTEMSKLLGVEEKTRIKGGPTAGFRAQIIDNLSREKERLSPSKRSFINEYLIKKMKLQKVKIGEGLPTYLIKKPTSQEIKDIQKYYLSRKDNLDKNLVERVKLFHNDPVFKKYTKKGLFLPQNEVMKKYLADKGMTYNQAAYAQIKLNHIYNGGSYNNWDLKEIGKNKLAANTFFRATAKLPFKNPYRAQQYVDAMKTVTDDLGPEYFGKKGTMQDFKNKARAILKEKGIPIYTATDKNPFGIQLNELTGVTAASRTQTGAMAQFFNLVPGQFNLGAYAAFNRTFEEAQINLENEIKKKAKGNPQKVLKDFNAKRNTLLKNYNFLKQGDVPTLSLQSPTEFYGEKFMKRMSDQGLDLEKNFKKKGYTIGVSQNVPTIKEFIQDEKVQKRVIKNVQPLVNTMRELAGTENNKCLVNMKQLIQRKADGGRIGFKFGSADPSCDNLAKQIVQKAIKGEGTPQQRSIVNKLIKGGADFLKSAADPVELLKLRNYVGPQALGFFAAYEAGVITDDVLRMGKPLNEAVASNWLTKSFLPYTEEFAKQENLLKSGTLTGNQRLFALDAMKYNKLLKEVERIEGMEDAQLTDQGGYGMIDGKPMVSQAEIDKAIANVTRVAETIDPSVLDPRSAKAIENKAKMDEMEATRMAKKKFSPIFGFDKLKNRAVQTESGDYLPDPLKIDLSPITYKNVEDFKPATELPAAERIRLEDAILPKQLYKPMDRSLSNFRFKDSDKSILEDELEQYNRAQRFKEAFQQPGILGASENFAGGGIAGLSGGVDEGPQRRSLNPDSQGLQGILNRVKKL